jgi:hypothetical protein
MKCYQSRTNLVNDEVGSVGRLLADPHSVLNTQMENVASARYQMYMRLMVTYMQLIHL